MKPNSDSKVTGSCCVTQTLFTHRCCIKSFNKKYIDLIPAAAAVIDG